jgi:hypothetical protein
MFVALYRAGVLSSFHTINRKREFTLSVALAINFGLESFHYFRYGQTLAEWFEANPVVSNFIEVLLMVSTV